MPYIKEDERTFVDKHDIANTAGQLNYLITTIILQHIELNGLKYQTINDIVGALESCKAEFQRRVVAPYEDLKITENGDLEYFKKG